MVVVKKHALRYAITDLLAQGLDNPAAREARLREQVRGWAVDGVDFIQLREKQLGSGELLRLTSAVLEEVGTSGIRLLVNGRVDIAAAAGAHGTHLTSRPGELTPAQARQVFTSAGHHHCLVSISCHTREEVSRASGEGADLILFSPVFGKSIPNSPPMPGIGLGALAEACFAAREVPLLALGGITPDNTGSCLAAGCAGVAGIRLFLTRPR